MINKVHKNEEEDQPQKKPDSLSANFNGQAKETKDLWKSAAFRKGYEVGIDHTRLSRLSKGLCINIDDLCEFGLCLEESAVPNNEKIASKLQENFEVLENLDNKYTKANNKSNLMHHIKEELINCISALSQVEKLLDETSSVAKKENDLTDLINLLKEQLTIIITDLRELITTTDDSNNNVELKIKQKRLKQIREKIIRNVITLDSLCESIRDLGPPITNEWINEILSQLCKYSRDLEEISMTVAGLGLQLRHGQFFKSAQEVFADSIPRVNDFVCLCEYADLYSNCRVLRRLVATYCELNEDVLGLDKYEKPWPDGLFNFQKEPYYLLSEYD